MATQGSLPQGARPVFVAQPTDQGAQPVFGPFVELTDSNIADPAQLGTGTRDGTKFLRDDGVWSPPTAEASVAWGDITGTLSNQTDLQTALDAKEATANKDAASGYAGLDTNARLTGTRLQVSASPRVIGRTTAGAGASEELTAGTGMSFAAGAISTTITQYTDELAQDAVGAMADANSLTYTDTTPLLEVKVQMSVAKDGSGLKLSGDVTSPGANQVYGTDSGGTKGWKADPTGGSGLTHDQSMTLVSLR